MDRGAWWATAWGHKELATTEHTHTHTHTHTIMIMMADFKEPLWIKKSLLYLELW